MIRVPSWIESHVRVFVQLFLVLAVGALCLGCGLAGYLIIDRADVANAIGLALIGLISGLWLALIALIIGVTLEVLQRLREILNEISGQTMVILESRQWTSDRSAAPPVAEVPVPVAASAAPERPWREEPVESPRRPDPAPSNFIVTFKRADGSTNRRRVAAESAIAAREMMEQRGHEVMKVSAE